MPKVKKIKAKALGTTSTTNTAVSKSGSSVVDRHEPLGQVITDETNKTLYATSSNRQPKKMKQHSSKDDDHHHRLNKHYNPNSRNDDDEADDDDDYDGGLLDEKSSHKIMELSKVQQIELEAEEQQEQQQLLLLKQQRRQQQQPNPKNSSRKSHQLDSDDDDDNEEEDEKSDEEEEEEYVSHTDEGYVTISDSAMGLSPEDEALVASMMNQKNNNGNGQGGSGGEERKTLADMILEKIEQKEMEKRNEVNKSGMDHHNNDDNDPYTSLPPKVIEVYTDIGKILSRYTSGKLPKAFKVIPSLSNWEEVLYLTRPDQWTPQAMYAATRIFASNLNPKMATKFYHLVLLDSIRNDIQHNKKLNYHYYMAIKKSVYKPASFFKGILLPLCEDPNCTLREAAIVASALQRVSIPVHHSAVAIHKLALMEQYSGASSIFIKTLLNKKYSLPVPVIGSLVQHFGNFVNDTRILPVLWHQALLVFVQRYKNEIRDEARECIKQVLKKHYHHKITPEIRRELFGVQAYKEERNQIMMEQQQQQQNNNNIIKMQIQKVDPSGTDTMMEMDD